MINNLKIAYNEKDMFIDKSYKQVYECLFHGILDEKEIGHFDEAALPSYTHSNKLMSFLFWKRVEIALQMAGDIRNASVLDFGCGGGVTFKHFQNNHCRITGCENEFWELTKNVSEHLNTSLTLLTDLFDAKEKYDRIFALDVLEHVDDLDKYTYQLKSLLESGGQIILSGPTENYLYKLGRKMAGFSGHYHIRNIYEIEKAFKKIGLQRVKLKILYPILPLFRITCWVNNS